VWENFHVATVYDEVPYANLPFAETRPDALATVARLHGIACADPRTARVLELACGAGANLAGIAAAEPGVRALGVDLSVVAIDRARETAGAAGLTNVRFEVADVRALVDARLGTFDYVIAHGLYAWSDEAVRSATLAAVRAHLAEDGVAYVSYTAHPGGHLRQMLREAGLWHARGETDPVARAERVRELFALLDYDGAAGEDMRVLATGPLEMLVHDLLGPDFAPVWLTDFVADAGRHGLAYVADALREPPLPGAAAAFVEEAARGDRVAAEQYRDIFVLRRLRQSVLCRSERRPASRIEPPALHGLLVGDPPVPFATLDVPAATLIEDYEAGRVDVHAVPPPAATAAGARPRASALARSQAAPGALVTTLLNQVVRITDEPTSRLIALLDGTRDRAAILRDFTAGPMTEEALEAALATLAGLGLLHE
jgi:SAM-dependent methyltransferase